MSETVQKCENNAMQFLSKTLPKKQRFLKMDQPRPLFHLFFVFPNTHYNFYKK